MGRKNVIKNIRGKITGNVHVGDAMPPYQIAVTRFGKTFRVWAKTEDAARWIIDLVPLDTPGLSRIRLMSFRNGGPRTLLEIG